MSWRTNEQEEVMQPFIWVKPGMTTARVESLPAAYFCLAKTFVFLPREHLRLLCLSHGQHQECHFSLLINCTLQLLHTTSHCVLHSKTKIR